MDHIVAWLVRWIKHLSCALVSSLWLEFRQSEKQESMEKWESQNIYQEHSRSERDLTLFFLDRIPLSAHWFTLSIHLQNMLSRCTIRPQIFCAFAIVRCKTESSPDGCGFITILSTFEFSLGWLDFRIDFIHSNLSHISEKELEREKKECNAFSLAKGWLESRTGEGRRRGSDALTLSISHTLSPALTYRLSISYDLSSIRVRRGIREKWESLTEGEEWIETVMRWESIYWCEWGLGRCFQR